MRPSTVRAKLNNNETVMFYCLHLTDPSVWEMMSLIGVDCIWFDMEHHGHTMETANNLFRAARVGTSDVICRPGKGEYMRMLRMLEMGAHGILYPRCTSAAEAREVVNWAKFAPQGERGFDGGNPDMPYCSMDMQEYIDFANEQNFIIIQIEDMKGLNEVDEIAAIDGVDGVMLGPGDFTVLNGIPGQLDHPKVHDALDRICNAATKAGKHWGSAGVTPERFADLHARGARLVFSGADLVVLKNAFTAMKDQWADVGVTFNDQFNHGGASYMEGKK